MPLEVVFAAIGEVDAGPGDEIDDRPCGHDLARLCLLDPGGDMNRYASHVIAALFDLTDVDAR